MVCIKAYEMDEIDAARLDYIYDLDVREMKEQCNPIKRMKVTLNKADAEKKIRIEGFHDKK